MNDIVTLEVFTDYVCPWCYLGDNRLKTIKKEYDIEVKLVHFPLHPETPAEGRELQDLFHCGPEEIAEKNNRMRGLLEAEGLLFKDRTHTYNSRIAQEIGTWAETQDGGDAIHDKFFEAYFVEGRNVGNTSVILDVVNQTGLHTEEAYSVIKERRFKDAVDRDWSKSHQYGVTGVPTFIAAGKGLVGAQPVEALEHLMLEIGAKKRSADIK